MLARGPFWVPLVYHGTAPGLCSHPYNLVVGSSTAPRWQCIPGLSIFSSATKLGRVAPIVMLASKGELSGLEMGAQQREIQTAAPGEGQLCTGALCAGTSISFYGLIIAFPSLPGPGRLNHFFFFLFFLKLNGIAEKPRLLTKLSKDKVNK